MCIKNAVLLSIHFIHSNKEMPYSVFLNASASIFYYKTVLIQLIKLLQLMQKTRVSSKSKIAAKRQPNIKYTPFDQILQINQNYSYLLRQLAKVTFADAKISEKARFLETVQLLRQIKLCLRKQSSNYDKLNSNKLADFIASQQCGNVGNLIGKYQQLKDEIQACKNQLQEAKQVSQKVEKPDLQELQMQLQKQLQQTSKKRIQVQNRQEMIRQQLQICAGEVKQGKGKLLQDQLKLRGLQAGKLR